MNDSPNETATQAHLRNLSRLQYPATREDRQRNAMIVALDLLEHDAHEIARAELVDRLNKEGYDGELPRVMILALNHIDCGFHKPAIDALRESLATTKPQERPAPHE